MACIWTQMAIGAAYDNKESMGLFLNLPYDIQVHIAKYVLTDDIVKRTLFGKPMIKHILQGHNHCVNFATFNTAGTQVVSAGCDGTARIWDAHTGQELHILHHNGWVRSAAFNDNGAQIVSASDDHTIRVWNAHTGQIVRTLQHNAPIILSVTFNSTGNHIISVSYDKTIRIWDAHSGQLLRTLQHNGPISPEVFNNDRSQIISIRNDNTLSLRNTHTGEELHILHGHTHAVNSAAFSPTGNQIVSASDDGTVRIWEPLLYERYHFDLEQALSIYNTCHEIHNKAEQPKNRQSYLPLIYTYHISKLGFGIRAINESFRFMIGNPELSPEKREQIVRKLAIEQSIHEQYPEIYHELQALKSENN